MRSPHPSLVALALCMCVVVPAAVSACAPSRTQTPPPPRAEPQGQPVAPAQPADADATAAGTPVPPGITDSKSTGMQVVGYLVPREGEWTVYNANPGSDEGGDASPLAALVPGKVDQAGIEAFSGRYISATGTALPGDDVPQVQVDKIDVVVEP